MEPTSEHRGFEHRKSIAKDIPYNGGQLSRINTAIDHINKSENLDIPPLEEQGDTKLIDFEASRGTNNLVYFVKDPETLEIKFVIKLFKDDVTDPSRFDREIAAINGLSRQDITHFSGNSSSLRLPTLIKTDPENNLAIYHFQSDYLPKEEDELFVKLAAEFASQFDSIKATPENLQIFPFQAASAVLKPGDILDYSDRRFSQFEKYFTLRTKESFPIPYDPDKQWHGAFVEAVDNLQIVDRYKETRDEIAAKIGQTQLATESPPDTLVFNQNDPSITNMLFYLNSKGEETITLVDWEYAGWDSRFVWVSDFVHHPQNSILSLVQKRQFLERFAERSKLSDKNVGSLNTHLSLAHLAWISKMLGNATPLRTTGWRKRALGSLYPNADDLAIQNYLKPAAEKMKTSPFEIQV